MPTFLDRLIRERVTRFLQHRNILAKPRQKDTETPQVKKFDFENREQALRILTHTRDVIKDALLYGVYGSDTDPSKDIDDQKPTYLAHLLRYQKNKPHSRVLATILSQSEELPIKDDFSDSSALTLRTHPDNSTLEFPKSFLKPIARSLANFPQYDAYLGTLMQIKQNPASEPSHQITHIITVRYIFKYSKSLSLRNDYRVYEKLADDSISSLDPDSLCRFDRNFLNQFFLLPINPTQLQPQELLSIVIRETTNKPDNQKVESYCSVVKEKKGKYWTVKISLDIEALMGNHPQLFDLFGNGDVLREILMKRKKEIEQTLLVCIGQTEIEGQQYWIWTGSEKPKLPETDKQAVQDAQTVPTLGSLGRANA